MTDSSTDTPGSSLPDLVELDRLCDDFERELKQDHAPRIQDYLDKFSSPKKTELLKALLDEEVRYRWSQGKSLDSISEHLSQFTQVKEVIDELRSRGEVEPQLGKFKCLRRLGRGGFGTVYQALDLDLKRMVAIKKLIPSRNQSKWESLFANECEILAKMDHPNIVRVHHVERDKETEILDFVVMDLAEGETLHQKLAKGRLEVDDTVDLIIKLCDALIYAQDQGLVAHRDLKPANILFDKSGEPKIADFGLALLDGHFNSLNAGTRRYMSPEQCRGDALTDKNDIYSLTLIALECLIGEIPADLETVLAASEDLTPNTRKPQHDQIKAKLNNVAEIGDILCEGLMHDEKERCSASVLKKWLKDWRAKHGNGSWLYSVEELPTGCNTDDLIEEAIESVQCDGLTRHKCQQIWQASQQPGWTFDHLARLIGGLIDDAHRKYLQDDFIKPALTKDETREELAEHLKLTHGPSGFRQIENIGDGLRDLKQLAEKPLRDLEQACGFPLGFLTEKITEYLADAIGPHPAKKDFLTIRDLLPIEVLPKKLTGAYTEDLIHKLCEQVHPTERKERRLVLLVGDYLNKWFSKDAEREMICYSFLQYVYLAEDFCEQNPANAVGHYWRGELAIWEGKKNIRDVCAEDVWDASTSGSPSITGPLLGLMASCHDFLHQELRWRFFKRPPFEHLWELQSNWRDGVDQNESLFVATMRRIPIQDLTDQRLLKWIEQLESTPPRHLDFDDLPICAWIWMAENYDRHLDGLDSYCRIWRHVCQTSHHEPETIQFTSCCILLGLIRSGWLDSESVLPLIEKRLRQLASSDEVGIHARTVIESPFDTNS